MGESVGMPKPRKEYHPWGVPSVRRWRNVCVFKSCLLIEFPVPGTTANDFRRYLSYKSASAPHGPYGLYGPHMRSSQISGKKPKNHNCCAFYALTKSLANKLTAIKPKKLKN